MLFKGDTARTENEMLRSLTFIRQIGYGFKAERSLLAMWPDSSGSGSGSGSSSGSPWEAKLTEAEVNSGGWKLFLISPMV